MHFEADARSSPEPGAFACISTGAGNCAMLCSASMSVPMPMRAGVVIAGKYRIDRLLGVGAAGIVVAAEHLQLRRLVALKFLHEEACENERRIRRFLREGEILARITSPHVAQVIDVGMLAEGEPYLVMEYLEGSDLGAVLRARGPLPIAEALSFILQASIGVAEAHACGIVHRDLKPSNLFLAECTAGKQLVKVLDFGISKSVAGHGLLAATYDSTSTGALVGSPQYMSPEQIRNAKRVDIRTDVWALGVILHEFLAGSLPFKGETLAGILAAIAADPPTPICRVRRDVPAALEAVILRCLRKNRQERYATIAEFSDALKPFITGEARRSMHRIRGLFTGATMHNPDVGSVEDAESGSISIPSWGAQSARSAHAVAKRLPRSSIAVFVALTLIALASWRKLAKQHSPRAEAATVSAQAPPMTRAPSMSPIGSGPMASSRQLTTATTFDVDPATANSQAQQRASALRYYARVPSAKTLSPRRISTATGNVAKVALVPADEEGTADRK